MIDVSSTQFSLFIVAAVVLAITPGPGITFIMARTAADGRRSGVAASFGTAMGGLMHVLAAAVGLSALITQSAILFTVIKYLGACYVIFMGIKLLRAKNTLTIAADQRSISHVNAFWQGFTVELFNVKTALFFLAFIPQFIDTSGQIVPQFLIYGTLCVTLNTLSALITAYGVGYLRGKLQSTNLLNRLAGSTMIGLGVLVATSDSKT